LYAVEVNFLHGKIPTLVVEAEWVVPVVKVMIQVIVNTIAGQDNLSLSSLKIGYSRHRVRSDWIV
jgi:hypothetical protein